MCRKCEQRKCDEKKCEERNVVEVCKKLIYLSADHPCESIVGIEGQPLSGDLQDLSPHAPAFSLDPFGGSIQHVCITSNTSFGFAITVKNHGKHDINITSLVDPLLTINNCCGSGNNFIYFCNPQYSDACAPCLNPCFKRHGEIVQNCIKICPGKVGIFTIRGTVNSRKLSVHNFAYLRYKVCGSDVEHVVRSDSESFCLENDFEGSISTNNGLPPVVVPVVGPSGPTGPTGSSGLPP